jgi:hypothetical protein
MAPPRRGSRPTVRHFHQSPAPGEDMRRLAICSAPPVTGSACTDIGSATIWLDLEFCSSAQRNDRGEATSARLSVFTVEA